MVTPHGKSLVYGARLVVGLSLLGPAVAESQSRKPGSTDSVINAAEVAITNGRPWQATLALLPLLRDSASRTPAVRLVAARAASRWESWSEVINLLDGASWLDKVAAGEGHALLARAYLERGQLDVALDHGRRAVALAPASDKPHRMVTLARAFDRADQYDSAAALYLNAAKSLESVSEWLRLRAAGLLADSSARADLYTKIDEPVTKSRIPWTEALARERRGDPEGAAARYEALGARIAAVRIRLGLPDSVAVQLARHRLVELMTPSLTTDETMEAIGLFDRNRAGREPADELRVARRAAVVGLTERAVTGFGHAGSDRLTDRDRFTYATALTRLGRYQEALPLFESVKSAELRGEAAYQRARAILRSGQVSASLQALERVVEQHPTDSNPAATALFLTADLIADRGGDDSARAVFRKAFLRYPSTRFGRRAGFQAALMAYLAGDFATAAAEFGALAADPSAEEALAGLYWAGRAFERKGDSAEARLRWQQVIDRDPESYYASRAGRRLGVEPIRRAEQATAGPVTERSSAPERAKLLRILGMRLEANLELDELGNGGMNPERYLAGSRQLATAGLFGHSVRAAQKAQANGAGPSRELTELLYPIPHRAVLITEADAAGLDPLLVASLIRQESAYDADARSVADARGLMQVLPTVGSAYARRLGIGEFDPVLLYQPDLNLHFGAEHLAEDIRRFGQVEHALAAYNAGVDRVERWLGMRGTKDDPELFVERIPFAETRDYVRRVLRNQGVYRSIYGTVGR